MTTTTAAVDVTPARAALAELQGIIEHDIAHQPRTLQTALGPSEIGTGCDRCLIHMLAGEHPDEDPGAAWLAYTGNAVHDFAEIALIRHLARTGGADWIPEGAVTVGQVGGRDITGHADVFHIPTGTVIDYKYAGTTTMRKVRKDGSGTSATYRRQFHLYGRGYALLGYDVRFVAGWYLPRNGPTLRDGRHFIEPYDEQVALDALARADQFHQWITALGVDTVLAAAAPHTDSEFSCPSYPDYADSFPPEAPDASVLAGLHPAAQQ